MKPRIFFFTLLTIILAFGFIDPNGIRAAAANNLWSIEFIGEYSVDTNIPPTRLMPPITHRHAGLFLAHQALKQDDLDSAAFYLNPLVARSHPFALQLYAEILFFQEEYTQAFDIWENLGDTRPLVSAGGILNIRGEIDLELLAFQSAYNIEPDNYTSQYAWRIITKANRLLDEKQYNEAIEFYKQAISQFPEDERPYVYLAQAYWRNNQPDLAFNAIEQGWYLNEGNLRFFTIAASILEEGGQLEKALQAYQIALEINPDHASSLEGVERLSNSE